MVDFFLLASIPIGYGIKLDMFEPFLGQIYWDPNPNAFVIPGLNHPITWYGIFFAVGFFVGYFIIRLLFSVQLGKKEAASYLTDRITLFVILGTLIGARLGHVFFYGWPYYSQYPLAIFKIWEGGLASHGGAVGIFIALFLFWLTSRKDYPQFTFLAILDAIVIPTAFVGGCIRIGNFFNQEILGKTTSLPWGVIFGHPIDGAPGIALHPAQLYEALFYFLIFAFLVLVWQKKGRLLGRGLLSGLFFALVFGFRFFIEFLKLPQSELLGPEPILTMGQWLSLPFVVLGIVLLCRTKAWR